MDTIELGRRLRAARVARGFTQEDLIERLGKTRYASDISEYENGRRKMSVVDLPYYAAALGVPITYFFEEVMPEDDLELAVVEWFRTLPGPDAKRRVFTFMKETAPLIIGGEVIYHEPKPIERSLNEPRGKFTKRKK
jgi:transcriptional regulator with XRE-family HTH domain